MGRDLVEVSGGVDLDIFHPVSSDKRQQLGLTDSEVILYVGRFAPLKNVALLIDAFALVRRTRPRARLLLVGEGALEARLRAQVVRLGIGADVTFAGAHPLNDLPDFYSAGDVFVLPSSFDNSPNVILEAMACGRPVIATRVGGVPGFVHDGDNGLLVEPGQADELAATICRVLDDPDLRNKLVAAGSKTVRTGRSWAASARRLLTLYAELTPAATNLMRQNAVSSSAGIVDE
jgi:glycosyltransferase involved in cell wall biosynthesis